MLPICKGADFRMRCSSLAWSHLQPQLAPVLQSPGKDLSLSSDSQNRKDLDASWFCFVFLFLFKSLWLGRVMSFVAEGSLLWVIGRWVLEDL